MNHSMRDRLEILCAALLGLALLAVGSMVLMGGSADMPLVRHAVTTQVLTLVLGL